VPQVCGILLIGGRKESLNAICGWMTGNPEIIPGQKSASRKRGAVESRPNPEFPEAGFWTASKSAEAGRVFFGGFALLPVQNL